MAEKQDPKVQATLRRRLDALLQLPANKVCAVRPRGVAQQGDTTTSRILQDCSTPNPRFMSVKLGVFLCNRHPLFFGDGIGISFTVTCSSSEGATAFIAALAPT
jgi:hypothetical protein